MPQAAHVGSDNRPIGPSYENVYSIGRVLLSDRLEHQVLFLVSFSEIYPVLNMAVLSKLWIAYKHFPDSSNKDDYLTTILLSQVSSVFLGRANKVPAHRSWI
jgi:hypothetical protein